MRQRRAVWLAGWNLLLSAEINFTIESIRGVHDRIRIGLKIQVSFASVKFTSVKFALIQDLILEEKTMLKISSSRMEHYLELLLDMDRVYPFGIAIYLRSPHI